MKKINIIVVILFMLMLVGCLNNQNKTEQTYVQVQTGSFHTVILTEDNDVYTFGSSMFGVLGNNISHADENFNDPINITSRFNLHPEEKIIQIYSGFDYNYAVTNQNRLFAWGNNNFKTLGFEPAGLVLVPTDITEYVGLHQNETIEYISVNHHSFILTSENRVIAFGNNIYGTIGNNTESSDLTEGVLFTDITEYFDLNEHDEIIYIKAANQFSLAITSNFDVYLWGAIGNVTYTKVPTLITLNLDLNDDEIITEVISLDTPAFKTNQNRLLAIQYTFPFPQEQDYIIEFRDFPINYTLDNNDQIKQIFTSKNKGFNGLILTENGLMIPWGPNNYNQLGYETSEANTYWLPPYYNPELTYRSIHENFSFNEDETIMDISIGRDHYVLTTSENRIFTWGRNTHGMLGNGTFEDSMLPVEITFD